MRSNTSTQWVMSSRRCKYGEGAGFPFQIESLKNGVDDSVHALDVDEADHGPGATAYLHKAALDNVGGAQLAPQVRGKSEEGKQFGQIRRQAPDHAGVSLAPACLKVAKRSFGLASAGGQIDGLRSPLHLVVIALTHFFQNIAHLVHPAALMADTWIDRLDGRCQSGTAVGHDQSQVLAFHPVPVQVMQQGLPLRLTLSLG